MSSNEKKTATLGMPHGTATSKLRKNIMFFLLQRLGEDRCVRCNKKIETADELSVEHIKPWEGISAELFWDLQNIAFSHMKCNRPHRTDGNRIIAPNGQSWCSGCQAFKSVEEFWKRAANVRGYDPYCITCRGKLDERSNHAKKV